MRSGFYMVSGLCLLCFGAFAGGAEKPPFADGFRMLADNRGTTWHSGGDGRTCAGDVADL